MVVGVYSYMDTTLDSLRALRDAGYNKPRVFSPLQHQEFEEFLGASESPVRFFALVGASFGAFCGLMLTILTSMDWPLRVSSKPIVSILPFMIIAFELTVLFGALLTLAGLLINSRLRHNASRAMYDPRFSEDRFGVAIVCDKEKIGDVEKILRSGGAEEVKFEGAG